MRNKIRPCTLWGKTFDACYVLKLSTSYIKANRHHVYINGEWVSSPAETGRYVVVSTTRHRYFSPLVKTGAERQALLLEAITTIAEALNAPVLATDAVLAGLPKDAEALVFTGIYTSIPYNLYWGRHRYSFGKDEVWFFDGFNTNFKNCRIQAKNDSKTAEYLRQFTLDGVRIKEGG